MKKLIPIFIFLLGILAGPPLAQATILDTEHDMLHMGKGTDPNVCSYCHIPHNAAGDKIWSTWGNEAQLENGPSSPIGNMCYTCHDGTATNIGQDTVFNASLQQHKVDPGADCNICHTVHDNTYGMFLGIEKTQSARTESATYCETCHDATMYPGAEPLGDHLAGVEHPYKDAGSDLDESCNSCHQVHGAVDYQTADLTNPILKQDNTDSAYCATCHSTFEQETPGGTKHPANLASGGTWGKIDCRTCHDPHQSSIPEGEHVAILQDPNRDSGFCTYCHEAGGSARGPSIGEHTHMTQVAFGTPPLDSTPETGTPLANTIDDDGINGPDYPANSAVMACETCHSPHLKGDNTPLVRITAEAGTLCINCHSDK